MFNTSKETTQQSILYNMLNTLKKIAQKAVLYSLAAVGLWYVGTSAALYQFGLTIQEAEQIGAVSKALPDALVGQ